MCDHFGRLVFVRVEIIKRLTSVHNLYMEHGAEVDMIPY